jgi:hypothetical protein
MGGRIMVKIFEVENNNTDTIENIIKIAQNIFGTDNLSSGNCGNFALALGKILKEKGLNPKLAFTFREVDDLTSTEISNQGTQTISKTTVSTETIDDVINAETDIYHTILKVNGQYYDGIGKTNTDELLDMADDQYDDYYPGFFDNIELNDPAMLKLIRTETNCQIPMQTFYQKIKEKI